MTVHYMFGKRFQQDSCKLTFMKMASPLGTLMNMSPPTCSTPTTNITTHDYLRIKQNIKKKIMEFGREFLNTRMGWSVVNNMGQIEVNAFD